MRVNLMEDRRKYCDLRDDCTYEIQMCSVEAGHDVKKIALTIT